MQGERRVVTVLFCDVTGSTAIAERLDPEEWAEIMDPAFKQLVEPVERYEGLVARLMGDAILAFFGAPRAHEDDPQRAVLAGLEIVERVRAFRERLRAERGIDQFDVRIGINTGLAVLGDVGSGRAVEYTALGDAVNVASRVQQLAEPGTVLLTEHTARLVAETFDLEALGAFEVKGRSAPIRLLRVVGPASARTRHAHAAPFVGRETELAALTEAIAATREGGGRIVTLVGESGLGKSRLIEELRARASGLSWHEARGQSFGRNRPFLLFRQLILDWCGSLETEEPEIVRAKVASAAQRVAPDTAEQVTTALAMAIGIEEADRGPEQAKEIQKEIARSVLLLARRELVARPAVIVFDDLHWSDAASGELLAELLALADECPITFVLSFRPDRQSVAWRARQKAESDYPHRHVDLPLEPLSMADSERLLDALLAGRALTPRLRERILAKAEGHPLFIEQFVRALDDHLGADAGDVPLPDTLVGLLAARIDRLEDGPRQTLQAASAIGRTFDHRVLRAISEANGGLERHLAELQRADLIHEDSRVPDRLFSFRHALLQEVAYGSILQRRRRDLHQRIGETLEQLLADRAAEYAALIGRHFFEAADPRAIAHLLVAGDRALVLNALDEALDQYDRALDLAGRFGDAPADRAALYIGRGRALELRGDWDAALAAYEEMERVGRERGDRRMEVLGLTQQVAIRAIPSMKMDIPRARDLRDRALPAARELGDMRTLARLLWAAMHVDFWGGDHEAAIPYGEESLRISREAGLRDQEAFTLADISRLYRSLGREADARAAMSAAAERFRELANRPMLTDALSSLAAIDFFAGDYDAALSKSAEALAISTEIGNLWGQSFSRFFSPSILFERGDWGRAITEWREGIRLARAAGFLHGQIGPAADLGWAMSCAGAQDEAEAILREARALADERRKDLGLWAAVGMARLAVARGRLGSAREMLAEIDSHPTTGMSRLVAVVWGGAAAARAELHLASGDPARAAEEARRAMREMQEFGVVPYLDEIEWLEGEAERRAGRLGDARAALERSRASSARTKAVRILWRTLASLALVEESEGRADAASRLRTEAAEIVERIARSLEVVGLAERFRGLPDVRALLPAEATAP